MTEMTLKILLKVQEMKLMAERAKIRRIIRTPNF
jgi:hypothetical protein